MIVPETPAELREWLGDLRAMTVANEGVRGEFGWAMFNAWPTIDALFARLTAAEAENANLARWKAEAMAVLTEWDTCYDILEAAGRGAPIGRSKARHVAEYLKRSVERSS